MLLTARHACREKRGDGKVLYEGDPAGMECRVTRTLCGEEETT
jgi:hypothetical protein